MTDDELLVKLCGGQYDIHWIIETITESIQELLSQEMHSLYALDDSLCEDPIGPSDDMSTEVCRELKESLAGTYKLYLEGHLHKKDLHIADHVVVVLLSDLILKSFLSKMTEKVVGLK